MIKKKLNLFITLFLIIISFNYTESSLKFNIPSHRDKCFQQEIYLEGTLLIRYDISGFEKYFKGTKQDEFFHNIKILVKNEKGRSIYESFLKNRKDKIAIYIKYPEIYQVCARYFKSPGEKDLPNEILMGIKIRNDFHYTEIDNSLHKDDVKDFWKRISTIKKDMIPSLEVEKKEIEEEDNTAKSMIHSINTYKALCLLQLIIIIFMTTFTLYSFKNYFKSKSII